MREKRKLLMLDLCSGLGGASQAMIDRGWNVIRIDNNPDFNPDIIADVRNWSWNGVRPDLVWASPPCTEFSRNSMPWFIKQEPDMSIVRACIRIIKQSEPIYWVIENVRGAVPYFENIIGRPRMIVGPYFLWGNFPLFFPIKVKKKQRFSGRNIKKQSALRAKIPYEISLALAIHVEKQKILEFPINNLSEQEIACN